jgi:hypothetical protein
MTINNNKITFSIILFRTSEDKKNKFFQTSSYFFLWDHRTDTSKEIELPGLKGKHMLNLTDEESETLWLNIFQKELSSLLNGESESTEETNNIYLNSFNYNRKIGGRYITECIISINNLSNWSEIIKAEEEYNEQGILDIKNGNAFLKFYKELIESPIYF